MLHIHTLTSLCTHAHVYTFAHTYIELPGRRKHSHRCTHTDMYLNTNIYTLNIHKHPHANTDTQMQMYGQWAYTLMDMLLQTQGKVQINTCTETGMCTWTCADTHTHIQTCRHSPSPPHPREMLVRTYMETHVNADMQVHRGTPMDTQMCT